MRVFKPLLTLFLACGSAVFVSLLNRGVRYANNNQTNTNVSCHYLGSASSGSSLRGSFHNETITYYLAPTPTSSTPTPSWQDDVTFDSQYNIENGLSFGPLMRKEMDETYDKISNLGGVSIIIALPVGAVEAVGGVTISGGSGDDGNPDTPGGGGSDSSGGSGGMSDGSGLSGGGDGTWGAGAVCSKDDAFAGILTGLGGGRPGSNYAPAQQAVQINESVQYHTLPDGTCVTIVTIDGDNHCLFHSLTIAYHQLDHNVRQEDVLSGLQLRERLALDHLQNPQILENAGIRGPVNRHQYVQRMLDTNYWGGDIEINQFAQLYNVGVVVYEPGVGGIFHPTRAIGPEIEGNAIHLAYDGSHYNVLLPIDCKELERLNESGGRIGPMLNGEQYRQMRTQRDQASMQRAQAGPSISRPSISSRLPGAASSIRLQKGKENVPPSKQSTKTGLKMTTGRARKMTSGPKKTNPVPKRPTLKKTAKKAVVFAASAAVSSLEGHGNMMLPSGQGQISPPLVPEQGQTHSPLDAVLPNGDGVMPQSPAFLELVNDIRGMDGYEESRDMIEPLLNAVEQVNGDTTHFVMYFGKCPRENLWNAEGYTSHAEGRNMEDNASWRGLQVIDSAVTPSNINYGNGLNGILINARPVCIRTNGHCLGYRSDEVARNKAFVERIGKYLAELSVPTLLLNVGGSGCNTFFTHLDTCLFSSVGDISPHMCSTTAWLWMSYDSPTHQLRRVSQKLIHTSWCIEHFKTKFLAPRGVDVSLPSLFDIASNSGVTAFVGNSHSGVDVQKANARQHEQCSQGGIQRAKNAAADLEERALDGESGIHKIKCTQPIDPPPVELPDGYTKNDFLTGDQTWICPYPDCKVQRGLGKGHPKKFDSSSNSSQRRMHVSNCKKAYDTKYGTSTKCGFERLGRPRADGYFDLTCERCQAAGGHRASKTSSWLDLGETTEVGLPCNENEADSSDGSDTETEEWDLAHVYTIKEMEKEERQMCEEDNCDRVACCRWESGNDQWFLCLDCQARVFKGPTWPDEMPIDCMSEDHRNYIATHCSDNLDPDMPDLPTGEESEEGSSESESEEESSESEASEESSDEDSEEVYEPAPRKRRKY